MNQSLALVSLLTPDDDAAIACFTSVLGFELAQETPLGDGRRWVVVAVFEGPWGNRWDLIEPPRPAS